MYRQASRARSPTERDPLLGGSQCDSASQRRDRDWKSGASHAIKQIPATLARTNANVLLLFVPLGIAAGALHWESSVVFALNFMAILPLAGLLSFATEELAATLGPTLGGLVNATCGNAVELIVGIIALMNRQIRIVQASMLGSLLSNILLVLGCCFLVGGVRYPEQSFNGTAASTMSSLMTVSSASLIIPATLYASLSSVKDESHKNESILFLSHWTAVVLLVVYVMYLYFQLKSHAHLFEGNWARDVEDPGECNIVGEEEEDQGNIYRLSAWAASTALIIVTVLVAICANYMVGSIDRTVEKMGISSTFIGTILIPIVGNAAEHATAVVVAFRGKMDLAINVAIGSSLQISLFVTPFLVVLGWIIEVDMTLDFHVFETVAIFLSNLVVVFLIQDGKSNYLEGCLCLGMYTILALAFYVYSEGIP
ncbi:calcium ion transporter Vcx1 [Aspergillus keveii]|uniref:Vacuolar calcium ion transporter n=1 Tax=Aspergillus keveii TaxID=714993 RepID=A0ABR4FHA2_9EURO